MGAHLFATGGGVTPEGNVDLGTVTQNNHTYENLDVAGKATASFTVEVETTDTSDSTLASGSSLLSGVSAYGPAGTKIDGSMPIQTGSNVTLYQSTASYRAGYYPNDWAVSAPGPDTSDATVSNNSQILSSFTAYANGTKYQGTMPSYTPTSETIQPSKTYQPGYYSSSWTVTSGGADTSDATATATAILSNTTAYIATGKVNGTMANKGSISSLLNPNSTYSNTAGYYSSINISANANTGTTVLSSVFTNAKLATGDTLYDMGISNTVRYLNTIGFGNAIRMIHTSNLNDNGVVSNASTGYADGQNWKKIITIPTASSLKVYYAYATQSGCDYCSIWSGSVTSSTITAKNPGSSTNVLLSAANGGTSSTSNPLPKEKGQLTVSGNTITVGFYSDGSVHNYYGFYVLAIDAAIANYINLGGGGTYSGTAVPSQVLDGAKFYSTSSTLQTGTMENKESKYYYLNPGTAQSFSNVFFEYLYIYGNYPTVQVVWTNPYPYNDFSAQTIYFNTSVSSSGTWLLIRYKDYSGASSGLRRSAVYSPYAGYSSTIDNRIIQDSGGTAFWTREFWMPSDSALYFTDCVMASNRSDYGPQWSNSQCIPTQVCVVTYSGM